VLIDCELMGIDRRIELHVRDLQRAWSFYCDIMGAQEVFRSESRAGGPAKIGFTIGKVGFIIIPHDHAGSHDGGDLLSQLATDFGASFVAIVIYVQDPTTAAQYALNAGSRLHPGTGSCLPTHRGYPVQVIVDPFGNSWAFAKS
jgi:catechol 2,3-dioxygenase-like lactoylglutathione lyase family enzyme